jgi:hypothetical protein
MLLIAEGDCRIVRGNQPPVALQADSRLAAGDRIETAAGARAAFALLPNVVAELRDAAELRILELSLTKDGNETGTAILRRTARCELIRGVLVVAQEEEPEMTAALHLVVETKAGAITSNVETVFRADAGDRRTRLLCGTGTVSFVAKAAPNAATLKAGEVAEWSAAGAATNSAASDARSQSELAEVLNRAVALRSLRDTIRAIGGPAAAELKHR